MTMFVHTRLRDTRRRGVIAVLVAGSLVTLLLCAALAIDVGHMCLVAAHQQINADAGALAGASGLQDQDSYTAYDRALGFIDAN